MGAVRAERQGYGPGDGVESEIAMEVRKERAAARRLPFQICAESFGIDIQKNEVALTGEMFGSGFNRW